MNSTVSASMAASVPTECPLCAENGIKSSVKLYQLSFEEATALCESAQCIFPLGSGGIVVQSVLNGPKGPLSNGNLINSPKKTEDALNSSVKGCSPVTSQVTTTSSSSYNWHSLASTPVYQPSQLPLKPPGGFSWPSPPSPPSSTQTSPALSVISASDKEVEFALGNKNHCHHSFDRLTPSPSPLPSKHSFNGELQQSAADDDLDSFLDQLTSGLTSNSTSSSNNFADEFADLFGTSQDSTIVSQSTPCSPPSDAATPCHNNDSMALTLEELEELSTCDTTTNGVETQSPSTISTSTTLPNPAAIGSKNVRVIRLSKITKLPNGVKPLPLPAIVKSYNSAPSINRATISSTPVTPQAAVKRIIRIPRNDPTKRIRLDTQIVKLPKVAPSIKQIAPVSSGDQPGPSTAAPPPTTPTRPQVALQVGSDGTPVFTIQPLASPSATPTKKGARGRCLVATSSDKSTPAKKVDTRRNRIKPKRPKKNDNYDDFDIDSIVSRFVQQANSRKIAAK